MTTSYFSFVTEPATRAGRLAVMINDMIADWRERRRERLNRMILDELEDHIRRDIGLPDRGPAIMPKTASQHWRNSGVPF